MLFKVIAGTHRQDGKVYKADDVVMSKGDLCKSFRNKFERVLTDTQEEPTPNAPNIPPPVIASKAGSNKTTEPALDDKREEVITIEKLIALHGEDCTFEFPTAPKVSLLVFKRKNWCVVVDPVDGQVLSLAKLRTKDIEAFLAQYIEE